MRKVTLLLAMIAFASFAFAQKGFVPQKYNLDKAAPGAMVVNTPNHTKAPGDVLFTETFDEAEWAATSNNGEPVPANAPAGWELGDLGGNGFYWRWDTIGPRGIFTGDPTCTDPVTGLQSTTGASGYMMLEADWFNSAADCSEYFDIGMDSYIEYNAGLDFSGETAAHLIFEQSNRMCCGTSATANALFSISTDMGTTWTTMIVSESNASNVPIGGIDAGTGAPYYSEFDISPLVAGEATVWFRFHMAGVSHYHWEVDDVAIVAPENYDMQFLDYWNDYIEAYTEKPSIKEDFVEGFYEYPWFLVQPFKGFHAAYINFGGLDQTNFVHKVKIYKNGVFMNSYETEPIDVPVGSADTTMLLGDFVADDFGTYEFVHYPSTDNPDEKTSNDTLTREFTVGDSMLSVVNLDRDWFDGGMSPDNWTSYDADGDGLGFTFNLPEPSIHDNDGNPSYYIVDGVYFWVTRNTGYPEETALFENSQAKAIASLYKYDDVADTYTQIINSEEITLTIDDTAQLIYLPFIQDFSSEYIFEGEGGSYLVALNMYGTFYDPFNRLQTWNIYSSGIQKNGFDAGVTVNSTIAVGDDVSWVAEGPAMALRIQYSDPYVPVGISDNNVEKLDFKVYPNPTNGSFRIDAEGTPMVTVFNAAGQVVHSQIHSGGPINLNVTTGVYFVRIQSGTQVGTQRLIVE
jgi:hypothetical protein